jgi:NDP-sugar pyrophosphorylase family protein
VVLETGGGLLKAKSLFNPNEAFISCNADFLTDLNIGNLVNYHNKHKALISFGVTSRKSSRVLLVNKDYRLVGWKNNSTGDKKIAIPEEPVAFELAYSCVVVFDYKVFELMDQYGFSGKFSLIDVYLTLAPQHLIMGYNHTGDKLVDVGKPESVAIAEELFP